MDSASSASLGFVRRLALQGKVIFAHVLQPASVRARGRAFRVMLRSRVRVPSAVRCEECTLYDFLGVPRDATAKSIKDAYRKSVKIWHPDLAVRSRLENAAHEFMKIHDAYLVLSDPQTRARYDESLRMQKRRFGKGRVNVKFAGITLDNEDRERSFRCTNWETDQCW
eukprot:TRINITY_DN1868_c0_g1_i3.p1 TRINITY_DN1868_c0_g1~~TRINITY_DN1868_c0_g1_i3.p1  ORF type:complete len:168 (+),score=6.18 TRINITY_DN1868_c0_g1_i3:389-892(+)